MAETNTNTDRKGIHLEPVRQTVQALKENPVLSKYSDEHQFAVYQQLEDDLRSDFRMSSAEIKPRRSITPDMPFSVVRPQRGIHAVNHCICCSESVTHIGRNYVYRFHRPTHNYDST